MPAFESSIALLIDHTLLKSDATEADIRKLCEEARQYGFASVCVNPCWVPLAAEELRSSAVKVCTVVGFPLGANATEVKSFETGVAMAEGAMEIDMVVNVGALRSGKADIVREDIIAVVDTAHLGGAIVKVILETALLTRDQKIEACQIAVAAGADFVKTSTGFAVSGATTEDVALLRQVVGPAIGVKASGGVRCLEDLKKMVAAGATRIGTSSGVRIIEATVPPRFVS